MKEYLGEKIIDCFDTPFENYEQSDWILFFIEKYSYIHGDHHKKWLLDQIARITNGTNIIIKIAEWSDGDYEYRITLDNPTKKYWKWVEIQKGGIMDNGDYEYYYDFGIAP
jgi:hypothetical protein